MSLQLISNRNVLKGSDSSGVIPTIPDAGVVTDVNDHTAGGWAATDIYDREFYVNTADHKVWMRLGTEIVLLGYSGMTSDFVDLQDVPSSYAGQNGKVLMVNSASTGLEYATISVPTISTDFSDMPSSLSGLSGYVISVDVGETGYTLIPAQKSFLQLSDVSTAYVPGNMLIMNSTGVTSVDASTLYVDLTSAQTVTQIKEWDAIQNFNDGILVKTQLYLSGVTELATINNITTNSSFTGANDNELATTSAIKAYVSDELLKAAGVTGYTGNYLATNTSTPQTIIGDTTYSATLYSPTLISTATTIYNANVEIDLTLNKDAYQYWGDQNTVGSYRMYINPEGNLCIDKAVSGNTGIEWIFRGDF